MQDPLFAEKIQRDLDMAASLQRGMLPAAVPTVTGYSFWASWQPALTISGDLYDVRTLPTGEIRVLVADVSGKGVCAALGMTFLSGMIPFALNQSGADLPAFVNALNNGVYAWLQRADKFITLIAVALDPIAQCSACSPTLPLQFRWK